MSLLKLPPAARLFAYDQPGQRICRLCFGSPVAERKVQHDGYVETIHDFFATQRFGVVWWKRRSDGSQHRVLAVLEALETPTIGVKVPDVSNKVLVHALIEQDGPAGADGPVDGFLQILDQIRDGGNVPDKLPSILFSMLGHQIQISQCFQDGCVRIPRGWSKACLN